MERPLCGFSARAAAAAASALITSVLLAPAAWSQQAQAPAPPGVHHPEGQPLPTELDMTFPTLPKRELTWSRDGLEELEEGEAVPPLKVGDRITVRIDLGEDDPPAPEVRVASPPGIKDYVDQGWSFSAPRVVGARTIEVTAIPVKGGPQQSIPPLALYDGEETQPFARTEAAPVGEVKGPRDPNEPPEEMLPPVSLEFPLWVIVVGGLVALALLGGAGFGAARLLSRFNRKPLPEIARPELPEDERALEALRRLKAEGLAARGRHKEHYFGVSETLKAYIGARFGFDASESTTHEMISAMEERKIVDTLVDRVESLFERLDLVKFTDHVPSAGEPDQVLEDARQIVLSTRRPKPNILPREASAG